MLTYVKLTHMKKDETNENTSVVSFQENKSEMFTG